MIAQLDGQWHSCLCLDLASGRWLNYGMEASMSQKDGQQNGSYNEHGHSGHKTLKLTRTEKAE
jgi:hypothetical protein